MTHPYLNRDYKTPLYSGKKTGTLFFGMFIGYALGLLTAIGIWMFISQAPSPFISQDKYFLQAGSFQNPNDADNMKAKLAMLGVEAAVQTAEVPQKGLWHRVRVGPFSNVDEMNRIRASLQQNGVQTNPIRVHEGA
jgi:hypothetical protein